MKRENIITALNSIDPELVADAEGKHKKSVKGVLLKWSAVAACFGITLAIISFAVAPGSRSNIPIYHSAIYTASDIASFFADGFDNASTSAYTKVYVPSSDYLRIHAISDSEYQTIYQYTIPDEKLSESEFTDFINSRILRIADELGEAVPSYTIEKESRMYSGDYLSITTHKLGEYYLFASQNVAYNYISFSSPSTDSVQSIYLGDVAITVDQTQSDEEISTSLSDVKEKLFSVFGAQFSDTRIIRRYDDYSEHGVTILSVYFYNEADHPLNAIMDVPVSDYICLKFDNIVNWDGDVVSDTVLSNVDVTYRQSRSDVNKIYAAAKQVKRISLTDAERLLCNGYVFGGHSCPLCMAQQSEVDFSDYDFVEIVYIQEIDTSDDVTEIIPFYAFYKKIGISENGNTVYAKTYVPAIEVSGYEEYFKSQQEEHNT